MPPYPLMALLTGDRDLLIACQLASNETRFFEAKGSRQVGLNSLAVRLTRNKRLLSCSDLKRPTTSDLSL